MRALVTGGCGLIGSHLVDLLLARGWDVRILDNLEPQTHPNGTPSWLPREAEFARGDVRDHITVGLEMRGIDVVFHQAAFGGFAPSPAKMLDVNATGTANVLSAAALEGVSKVVVASSQAVYGPRGDRRSCPEIEAGNWDYGSDGERPIDEEEPLDPRTPYAISKFAAERTAIASPWPFPVVALRYALTYGPRQSVSNPYTGICSIFATRLLNGLPPVVYEDGQQTRDFTYVGDVAAANLLVAEDPRADGGVFNVGTGIATTVSDFEWALALALEKGGADIGLERQPETPGTWRPGDARHVVTDPSKLHALGWEPTVTLAEGLRRYAEWFLEQPTPPEVFAVAEAGLRDAGIVVS